MRPGQNQNKQRMRGRPTNNRRGPNPLTRSYESNGPDVKISRQCAPCRGEISAAGARRAHGRGSGRCGKLSPARRTLFRLIAAAQAAQLQARAAPAARPANPKPKMRKTMTTAAFSIVSLRQRNARRFPMCASTAIRPSTQSRRVWRSVCLRGATTLRKRSTEPTRPQRLPAPLGSADEPKPGPRRHARNARSKIGKIAMRDIGKIAVQTTAASENSDLIASRTGRATRRRRSSRRRWHCHPSSRPRHESSWARRQSSRPCLWPAKSPAAPRAHPSPQRLLTKQLSMLVFRCAGGGGGRVRPMDFTAIRRATTFRPRRRVPMRLPFPSERTSSRARGARFHGLAKLRSARLNISRGLRISTAPTRDRTVS